MVAPVAKSSRGRGGGSRGGGSRGGGSRVGGTHSKKKPATEKRYSSTSSNPMTSNHSPPSVGRKSLPPQYALSPGGQTSATASHRALELAPPRRTPSGPPSGPPSMAQNHREPEDEEEEEEDYVDAPEEYEAPPRQPTESELQQRRENQISLEQLLIRTGREEFLPKLSPTEGEGLWFTRDDTLLVKKISKILKEKFDGPYYSWSVTPIDVQDRYFIQLAVCVY